MTQNNEGLERQVLTLVATDRIEMPISSMSGKLKRRKPKMAQAIPMPESGRFKGERAYARVAETDKMKARSMKEAVAEFAQQYPTHGKVLYGLIAEKRLQKEKHLYFGMNDGCRLTADDYMSVMTNLGFSEARAEGLYEELIAVSRNLSRQRGQPERSVLVGKCFGPDTDDEANADED